MLFKSYEAKKQNKYHIKCWSSENYTDTFINAKYGFMLATVLAALLFIGFLLNMIFKPTYMRISKLNESEYENLNNL